MRRAFWLAAAVVLCAGPAFADKMKLAIVVEGRDNPAYAAIGNGCARWNDDNKDSNYQCVFTGPASRLDKQGELAIIDDMITTGAAGIAIASSDPAAVVDLLRHKQPPMPIVTLGKDFAPADQNLRQAYVTSDEYMVGAKLAELVKAKKSSGGVVCIQEGAADDAAAKARVAGFRDTLAGAKGAASLTGQNNWREPSNCPIVDDGTAEVANKAIAAVLAANPSLDALVLAAGEGPGDTKAYAKALAPAADRLKSGDLVIVAAGPPQLDAIKAGRLQAQAGQRDDEVGRTTPDLLLMLAKRQKVPDPFYVGVETCTAETLATCKK